VRDPTAHPKVNASTYHPPQSAVWNNAGKSRTNTQNGVREIQIRRRRGNNSVAANTKWDEAGEQSDECAVRLKISDGLTFMH
jgi:hypothetical protein